MYSASRRSNSTATNGLPEAANSRERAPRPGPISRTGSRGSGIRPAIRCATRGSDRKLWPRRLLGRTPRERRMPGTPDAPPPLEPEERSRRGVGPFLQRGRSDSQRTGKLIAHECQVRRLVSLPAMGHRSKVGRVRFQNDVLEPELADDAGQDALLEGGGAADSDLEPHRDHPPRQGQIPGEAMKT